MTFDDMMAKVLTLFQKEESSNLRKIFQIAFDEYKLLEDDFNKQFEWQDINKAKGIALDAIGLRVGLPRGTMDDEMYRIRIRAKIAQNLSDGTINKVIEALAMALSTDPRNIGIEDGFEIGQPASIRITGIPIDVLNQAAMTTDELIAVVKQIVALGINVSSIDLNGTFAFSSIIDSVEENSPYGFADEAMTQGGTLGAVLSVE